MSNPSVRLICPNLRCRCLLSVPVSARGKTVRCKQCGARIQVPAKAGVKRAPDTGQADTAA